MAIDTLRRRSSVIGVGRQPWMPRPILPDGSLSAFDRQQIAWKYRGIDIAGGSEGGVPGRLPLQGVGV